jgi:hypothetical protein
MFREVMWRKRAKECLDKIDPLDSIAFDVGVARHAMEEGDYKRARTWLDGNHAAGEFRKAIDFGLLKWQDPEVQEMDRLLMEAWDNIERDPVRALKALQKLQEIALIRAYIAFTKCVTLGINY